MSHSFPKVWVHLIFGTKLRAPLITPAVEPKMHNFLKQQLIDKGCYVKAINGTQDHIHALFSLNQNISLADLVKQLKGSSSHWVNLHNLTKDRFAWQTGYGAFSVSESQLKRVEKYIQNQKEHHKRKSFQEEFDQFLDRHNIKL